VAEAIATAAAAVAGSRTPAITDARYTGGYRRGERHGRGIVDCFFYRLDAVFEDGVPVECASLDWANGDAYVEAGAPAAASTDLAAPSTVLYGRPAATTSIALSPTLYYTQPRYHYHYYHANRTTSPTSSPPPTTGTSARSSPRSPARNPPSARAARPRGTTRCPCRTARA